MTRLREDAPARQAIDPSVLVQRASAIHDRIACDAGISEARVTCLACGREQLVDGATCLRKGWPTCHGATMRLVSPGDKENPPPAPARPHASEAAPEGVSPDDREGGD